MHHPTTVLLAATTMMFAAFPASAQVDASFLAGQSAQMGTSMYLADMVRRQSGAGTGASPRGAPAPSRRVAAPVASLTFHITRMARQESIKRFFSQAERIDPASAARARKVFAGEDVFGKIESWMRGYDLSSSNLADCVAVYLASAWMATRGTDADPSHAQMAGLRAQVTRSLLAAPELTRASDASKQNMADSNLIQALIVSQYAAGAKTDPASRPSIRAAVAKGARSTYGVDLLSVRLTAAGFVPG